MTTREQSNRAELNVRNFLFILGGLGALYFAGPAAAQDTHYEYIDIRWDGTDRMCVVYGDGRVDFVGKELEKVPRPDDANKRAFYMTLEVNKMAALGYEFVSMISDEIVMRRRALR
jgi:hypothetical protein